MPQVRPLHAEGAVEVSSLYLDLLGRVPLTDRPHTAVNMVTSADGRATLKGTADIGSRVDRALLKHLRTLADAVMTGAGTLRASDFAPRITGADALERRELAGKRPQPLAVVVSRGGDLPLDSRFMRLEQERVVAVAESARERRGALESAGATVITLGAIEVDLTALARWLRRERGVRFLLCEGGPHLNGQLLAARLLDEVFLTEAWRITGEVRALRWVEIDGELPDVRLEPIESYEGEGERYNRFRVRYP